jgi:hypothetical protein
MEKCSIAFWFIPASLDKLATEEHPAHTRERFSKWQSIPNWAEVQCIGSFITYTETKKNNVWFIPAVGKSQPSNTCKLAGNNTLGL